MRKLIISILSWLLHYANRKYHDEEFYAIKNRLLKKYGKHICYDVQFIEGKSCYTCDGTGIYIGYRWSSIHWGKLVTYKETCNSCYQGWYKRPVWNILARLQFGKYTFHQPFQRSYTKPDNGIPVIDGYIDHKSSKHSDFAATILFLLYEKSYLKRWYKSAGWGWYVYWWRPSNWPNNFVYMIKHRPKIRNASPESFMACYEPDDMPF
jgi:hypothetical protein